MSQRRRIRQQVVGDADPLLDCAGRRTEDELPAESENASCSAGATARGTRLEDSQCDIAGTLGRSHSCWRKGRLTAASMRARGSQRRKCLTAGVFRIGLVVQRRARTYFIRHPWSGIKLS
jgi:hypothetical protein